MKTILKNQLFRLVRMYTIKPSSKLWRMIRAKSKEITPDGHGIGTRKPIFLVPNDRGHMVPRYTVVFMLILCSLVATAQTDSLTVYDISGTMGISAPLKTDEHFTHVVQTNDHWVLLRSESQPNVGRILSRDTVGHILRVLISGKLISVQVNQTQTLTNFRIYSDGNVNPDYLLISDRKRKY